MTAGATSNEMLRLGIEICSGGGWDCDPTVWERIEAGGVGEGFLGLIKFLG